MVTRSKILKLKQAVQTCLPPGGGNKPWTDNSGDVAVNNRTVGCRWSRGGHTLYVQDAAAGDD